MFNLDETFLEDLGLGSLPQEDKTKLLDYCLEMLEMRVGTQLTGAMSDAQLDEFEAMADAGASADSVMAWIKTNFPHYDQMAATELAKLKDEIKTAYAGVASQPGTAAAPARTGDLFKQLGLAKLSRREKLELSEDLGGVVMNRVADRLEALLTPEQAAEFEAALRTNETEAFALLEKFVPNYGAIITEEIDVLRDNVVNTQAEVMKRLNNQ